jgi:hypothetical protein
MVQAARFGLHHVSRITNETVMRHGRGAAFKISAIFVVDTKCPQTFKRI